MVAKWTRRDSGRGGGMTANGKRQVYVANAIIIKLFFNLNSNVMEQQPNECSAHFGRHLTIWRLEMTQHGQRGRRSIDATNVISTQTHTERERGGKRAHNVRVHCMSSVYWRELKKLVGENLCLRTIWLLYLTSITKYACQRRNMPPMVVLVSLYTDTIAAFASAAKGKVIAPVCPVLFVLFCWCIVHPINRV